MKQKKTGTDVIAYEKTYIPAAYCKDIYADKIDPESDNYDETMAEEFTDLWICPNVTEFQLLGDPWMLRYSEGTALLMEVTSCNIALKHDQTMLDRGLSNVTYTNEECYKSALIQNKLVDKVIAWTKIMTQDPSNPVQLLTRNSNQKTYFSNRQKVGLMSDRIFLISNPLSENKVYYNSHWLQQMPVTKWFY